MNNKQRKTESLRRRFRRWFKWSRQAAGSFAIGFFAPIALGIATWILFKYNSHFTGDVELTRATWALVLVTFVLAVGVPVTIWDSSRKAREQEEDQFYAQLDGMYLEIQKLVIENPHLGDPAAVLKQGDPENLAQYDAFAFVVWNFIESIDDFTRKDGGSRLARTWKCIIKHEAKQHAQWFLLRERKAKFKPKFYRRMQRKLERWTEQSSQ